MTAYYNENDPYAAQWLRNLIEAGHIASGVVDNRSIKDVRASDLAGFTQCHFFAGIGIWSHALRTAGWPDDRPVWTGSCPCQPFSSAGKRQGIADERHLWPIWFPLINECRPAIVFGEQVARKDGRAWWDIVSPDLEAASYACGVADLAAAGIGAPHIRQRLYWVANAHSRHEEQHKGAWPAPRHQEGQRPCCGPQGCGDFDGMADNGSERRRARGGAHQAGKDGGTLRGTAHADSGTSRLAYADGWNGSAERQQRGGEQRQQPEDCGADDTEGAAPLNSFWGNADWLGCTDGRWRPVEPGTQPLAHGYSGRVGMLRAFGNAIIGPLAVEFIESVMECM